METLENRARVGAIANSGTRVAAAYVDAPTPGPHTKRGKNIEECTVFYKLLAMENQLDPLTIIFIMKIIEVIGDLANYAENCGDNLRHLILSRT